MLRNCLKKGFRPVAVLVVAVLMCSLGGCSDSESGWLEGRAFTMNAYSNTGELTLTSHAEKIGLDGNVTTDPVTTASAPMVRFPPARPIPCLRSLP